MNEICNEQCERKEEDELDLARIEKNFSTVGLIMICSSSLSHSLTPRSGQQKVEQTHEFLQGL